MNSLDLIRAHKMVTKKSQKNFRYALYSLSVTYSFHLSPFSVLSSQEKNYLSFSIVLHIIFFFFFSFNSIENVFNLSTHLSYNFNAFLLANIFFNHLMTVCSLYLVQQFEIYVKFLANKFTV